MRGKCFSVFPRGRCLRQPLCGVSLSAQHCRPYMAAATFLASTNVVVLVPAQRARKERVQNEKFNKLLRDGKRVERWRANVARKEATTNELAEA